MKFICPIIACSLLVATSGLALEKPTDSLQLTSRMTSAIEKSIPRVIEGGESWMKEKKCSTCHRVTFMTWGLASAKQKGFDVDTEKLDGWIQWSIEDMFAKGKTGQIVAESNLDGVAQILISIPVKKIDQLRENSVKELVAFLENGQAENGTWKPNGQLPKQKRKPSETIEVSTMWNALALQEVSQLTKRENAGAEQVSKALKFLKNKSPGKSTEWLVAAILLANELDDNDKALTMLSKLKETQNEDGGFGWLIGEKSDALGTSMALFAFHRLGKKVDDKNVNLALNFLVNSQKSDGTWDVPGTKTAAKNKVKETSSYWGTAWSLIVLAEYLEVPTVEN